MNNSFEKLIVKALRGKDAVDLLEASPAVLLGISAKAAQALTTTFRIRTVRDLATHRYFHSALALLAAAGEIGFDPGPPLHWQPFLGQAPLDFYVNHPARRFRLDFGPVYYRGRLDGTARLLLVGQDPSTNEILAQRVFVGKSGQRVQGFLRKLGLTRSYAMMNVFLYSVFGQFDTRLRRIALEPAILDFRNAFLDRLTRENPIHAIVAVGNGARVVLNHWPGATNLPIVEITHPAAPNEAALLASWNRALNRLRPFMQPDPGAEPDPQPYRNTFQPEDEAPIPRQDLPFGLPEWHGTGSRSTRDGNQKIIWTAP